MEKQRKEEHQQHQHHHQQQEENDEDMIISFSDMIDHHPFFQQDVPCSSICKLKSLIVGSCFEIEENQNQQQIEKINQIKSKYIQHLQGSSSSSSSSSSYVDNDDEITKKRCTIENKD